MSEFFVVANLKNFNWFNVIKQIRNLNLNRVNRRSPYIWHKHKGNLGTNDSVVRSRRPSVQKEGSFNMTRFLFPTITNNYVLLTRFY